MFLLNRKEAAVKEEEITLLWLNMKIMKKRKFIIYIFRNQLLKKLFEHN
jgi:hypothetical protein